MIARHLKKQEGLDLEGRSSTLEEFVDSAKAASSEERMTIILRGKRTHCSSHFCLQMELAVTTARNVFLHSSKV